MLVKKRCGKCGKLKVLDEFGSNRSRKDGKNPNCKLCHRQYTSGHYQANLAYYRKKARKRNIQVRAEIAGIVTAAKVKPCTDCGRPYPPYVMDFDHVRGVKEFEIGTARTRHVSIEHLLAEIAKCEVVCSNCHRQRTYDRRNGPVTQWIECDSTKVEVGSSSLPRPAV